VRLDDDEVEGALYCVAEVVDRRRRAGIPTPHWMLRLARRLDLTSAMSPTGHESDCAEPALDTGMIATQEAANLLGLSTRQVRRLRSDLDGQMIGGSLAFRRDTVTEYAQERHGGHVRREPDHTAPAHPGDQ
jgi:hypothetical protein